MKGRQVLKSLPLYDQIIALEKVGLGTLKEDVKPLIVDLINKKMITVKVDQYGKYYLVFNRWSMDPTNGPLLGKYSVYAKMMGVPPLTKKWFLLKNVFFKGCTYASHVLWRIIRNLEYLNVPKDYINFLTGGIYGWCRFGKTFGLEGQRFIQGRKKAIGEISSIFSKSTESK